MTALVAAVDEGTLAAAARRLGRSPAAVTRAIAFLESQAFVDLVVPRLSASGVRSRASGTGRRGASSS